MALLFNMKYLVETSTPEAREELKKVGCLIGTPKTLSSFLIVDSGQPKNYLEQIDGVLKVEPDDYNEQFWALPYISGEDHEEFNPTRTGKNVDIYIMDSGVYSDHLDLDDRVETIYSYDGEEYERTCGHGTGSASCAAGQLFGVARKSNIFNVRYNLNRSDGIKALDNILDHHLNKDNNNPSILNMSFGSPSRIISDALYEAYKHGIICVAAAGNDDSPRRNYPASNPFVISVMANNRRDKPSQFTNYSDRNDIFAPGTQVKMAGARRNREVVKQSGTSFAAPLTAGVLALIVEGSIIQSSEGVDKTKELLLNQAWSDYLDLEGKYEGLPNLVSNCHVNNEPIQDKHIYQVKVQGPVETKTIKEAEKGQCIRFKFYRNVELKSDNNPGGTWVNDNIFKTNPIDRDCEYVFE